MCVYRKMMSPLPAKVMCFYRTRVLPPFPAKVMCVYRHPCPIDTHYFSWKWGHPCRIDTHYFSWKWGHPCAIDTHSSICYLTIDLLIAKCECETVNTIIRNDFLQLFNLFQLFFLWEKILWKLQNTNRTGQKWPFIKWVDDFSNFHWFSIILFSFHNHPNIIHTTNI
jgi:hypothetical protein